MKLRPIIPDGTISVIVDGTRQEWSVFVETLEEVLGQAITDVNNSLWEVEEDEWEAKEWLAQRHNDLRDIIDFVQWVRHEINAMFDSQKIGNEDGWSE